MSRVLLLALGTALATSMVMARLPDEEVSPEAAVEIKASLAAIEHFSITLKDALQQAVNDSGPVSAIAVCRDQASHMADQLAQQQEMLFSRTGLRIRNPDHAPDNWELAVLKQFEARKAQGEAAEQLEFFAIIDDDHGQRTFRYMKAIPASALCLPCHGHDLSTEINARLHELYPHDKARGFRQGELLGAFTISKPLP